MKQIQLNSGVFLLVEVPEDAYDFVIDDDLYYKKAGVPCVKNLNGQWEIIGKGNEITEEVWRGIVEELHGHFLEYDRTSEYYTVGLDKIYGKTYFNTATESGHSWIKSHGMKPETTLILKLK